MNPLFLLVAVPVFGLLVIVHEFGHFIVAKRSGIRVEEFAIGFPPRLASLQRGETKYSINLLPIGGYVKMPGENGETTDASGAYDPRSFGSKRAGIRAAVLLAGVTMNFLLAIVLFSASEAVGHVEYPPVVAAVEKGSPADKAGIQVGDRIVAVNGRDIQYFSQLVELSNGIVGQQPDEKTVPMDLDILHKGATQAVTITVNARHPDNVHPGPLGITRTSSDAIAIRPPLWQAPLLGVQDIGKVTVGLYQGIGQVVRGVIPANQAVTGPVGIVNITGQTASEIGQVGFSPLLFLAGFLSLNLAIFNLLPVPGLDGGRLLFVLIEVLRRGKRVSPQREAIVHLIGMAVLLGFVLLVTINDVSNIGH